MVPIREHEIFPDIRDVLDRLDSASPAGAYLGQVAEGLIHGRQEYYVTWDDLRFPASAINPPGQASDPGFDVVNGGYLFDATAVELLYVIAQLPHGWKEGSELRPHFHWQKTTAAAGDVMWRLDYQWSTVGVAMTGFTTVESYTPATPSVDIADSQMITAVAPISGVGYAGSDILMMKISRIGSATEDDYGADARLLEFDIHYQIDATGSNEEYLKTEL